MSIHVDISSLPESEQFFYTQSDNDIIIEALIQGYNVVNGKKYAVNSKKHADDYSIELEREIETLNQELHDKTKALTLFNDQLTSIIDDRVSRELKNHNELSDILKERIIDKETIVRETLEKNRLLTEELKRMELGYNNSSIKGDIGEKYINDILKEGLLESCIIGEPGKTKTGFQGDTHIIPMKYSHEENPPLLLLETKNYADNSKGHMKKEIEKFHRDINNIKGKGTSIIAGIFISLNCEIPGKDSFSIEEYNGVRTYFISNFSDVESKILLEIIKIEIDNYGNVIDNNKNKEVLLHSFIGRYIKLFKHIKLLDPGYDKIKESLGKAEREYNKMQSSFMTEIDMLANEYDSFSTDEFDDILVESLIYNKRFPSELNQLEFDKLKIEYLGTIAENKMLKEMESNPITETKIAVSNKIKCNFCEKELSKTSLSRHIKQKH